MVNVFLLFQFPPYTNNFFYARRSLPFFCEWKRFKKNICERKRKTQNPFWSYKNTTWHSYLFCQWINFNACSLKSHEIQIPKKRMNWDIYVDLSNYFDSLFNNFLFFQQHLSIFSRFSFSLLPYASVIIDHHIVSKYMNESFLDKHKPNKI